MPRYAFKIEYNGGPFAGWQRQRDQASVQGALEAALDALDPGDRAVRAAGRTDAGVHATGQVAHADLTRAWDPFRLAEALNHHMKPLPVAITTAAAVSEDFHARFSARDRHYLYRLVSRRAPVTLDAGQVWQQRQTLELAPMQEAAHHLIGHHDFTTFRSSICQASSPLRTVDAVDITAHPYPGGTEFRFAVRARSFL
ncbi:MAG: tRNA pseudouridine synthase A, partial [Pseudomonadota bacterium]